MKTQKSPVVLLAFAVLLCACSSDKRPQVVAVRQGVGGTVLPSVGLESVRYGENIKAYPVSRYIDPNDPYVMHEGHILYRTETTAKWNLHPNLPVVVPLGPTLAINNPARRTSVVSGELESELASQRARSVELVQQNQRLTSLIDSVQSTMQKTDAKLQQSQQTDQKVKELQDKVDDLNRQLQANKSTAPAATPSPDQTAKKNLFD